MKKIKEIILSPQFISLFNQGITAVLSFISFLLLTRLLGLDEFGKWTVILTAFTFFDMFRSGLLHSALILFGTGKAPQKTIASCWTLGIVLTIVSSLVSLTIYSFDLLPSNGAIFLLVKWFPLIASGSLLYNISLWICQLEYNFRRLLIIRVSQLLIFIFFLGYNFFNNLNIESEFVLIYYIISIGIPGLLTTLLMINKPLWIKYFDWSNLKDYWGYGKYTIASLIGTNLLKSSDIFIISMFLGDKWVGIYAIPLKVIEVIEIPIRALIATALPKFSKYFHDKSLDLMKRELQVYSGSLTIFIIPILILSFVFAPQLISFLGGEQLPDSVLVLQIFTIYGLLVPLDRFLGVTLDSLKHPHLNSIKIYLMVVINIIGDVILLKLGYSIAAVALMTIVTSGSGILFGTFYVKSLLKIKNIFLFILSSFNASITFIKEQTIGKPTF